MRTGYTQIDEWPVRPYSKRELAMAYAPDWIDLNMGCPAPKVAGNGGGSALIRATARGNGSSPPCKWS